VSERPPDLETLVGDLDPAERGRLDQVHELLVAAGPPPEMSPRVSAPPREPRPTIVPIPRRHRVAALGVAAVVALGLLGVGYVIGRGPVRTEAYTTPMSGPGGATAEIVVFERDAAGNWPMKLTVHHLAPAGAPRQYELWLTRDGDLAEPCGAFAVSAGTATDVPLNAPWRLRDFDGWVVVAAGTTTPVLRTDEI
jgi:hypothetical protein